MTTTITCDRCSVIIEKAVSPSRFVADRILDEFLHDEMVPSDPDLCDTCARYLIHTIHLWWDKRPNK